MFFSLDSSDGTYLDHSIFLDFATSRTVQTPLRNLRRLDINVGRTHWSMKIVTLFLHERLESLTIRDPSKGRPHSHLAYLLSETAIRADKLTSLILHVHCSAADLGLICAVLCRLCAASRPCRCSLVWQSLPCCSRWPISPNFEWLV